MPTIVAHIGSPLEAAHLDELHVAATRITLAREDRDNAIREAYRDGVLPGKIAEAAELSRQRVHQIVRTR